MITKSLKNESEPEFSSIDEVRDVQAKRLIESVRYAFKKSPFYRKYYSENGFHPDDIKSVEDIEKIPFINRRILGENCAAITAVPQSRIIDINATSGTTGKPLYVPMTAGDLRLFSGLCARGFKYWNIGKNDTAQMMLSSDNLIIASKILGTSLEKYLGATNLRVGPVGTERQITIMKDLKPNIMIGISSYFLSLGRRLIESGFDPGRELNIKALFSTASVTYHSRWTPMTATQEFSRIWKAPVCSVLGTTESCVAFFSCPASNGHHIHWDHIIAEIIDPKTGKTLPPGQQGELVITFCGREAFPLIRYRTSDITTIETGQCSCGRTNPRIMAITGRLDEMIQIKGRLIFPIQIEEAVLPIPGVVNHLTEIRTDENGIDQIIVTLGTTTPGDSIKQSAADSIKSNTHITPEIRFNSPENIEKIWFSEQRRVPRKFRDRRCEG
jgi:phenylacetate-CoA ligase